MEPTTKNWQYQRERRAEAGRQRIHLTISRHAVQRYGCPKCGAVAEAPCIGYNGRLRVSNHMERVMAATGWS